MWVCVFPRFYPGKKIQITQIVITPQSPRLLFATMLIKVPVDNAGILWSGGDMYGRE